jgi:hypothetical protein
LVRSPPPRTWRQRWRNAAAARSSSPAACLSRIPQYTSLSPGKAGLRALVSLLDKQYGQASVHFAVIIVAGTVESGTVFHPDDIAEHYWRLHCQPRGQWQREIVPCSRRST